ncbi:hypothetical protein AQPE_2756 [Aquipluma nitroreducens]|uniref:Uncharacterized protein n=1 Tax=Aquipluma nitroreducens TaxID=2010828 RepID=A0A5K7SAI5_9BACT|nr:hypothetical protein AQPE_2756 [Aquipluma nitroreducens]
MTISKFWPKSKKKNEKIFNIHDLLVYSWSIILSSNKFSRFHRQLFPAYI